MHQPWHSVVAMLVILGCGGGASAQPAVRAVDLALLSIEDLMNVEITSASRKEERLADVAAAVYVITQEDIRRSGMTTLPELFRLVPGLQVAQINANKWAIAVRGFNDLFADKVLVLVDGRTVYDRLNAGVFWESLDIPLDLIDRIEVIRGPGGATWGANAVNGVINVVTRSAAATRGAAAAVGAGTFDGVHGSARYGGMAGTVAYRLYSQWAGRSQSRIDADTPANDAWASQVHGGRLDWERGADRIMAQGAVTLASLRGLFPVPSGPVPAVKPSWPERVDTHDYYALGRWTHRRGPRASLEVQSFVNYHHAFDSINPRQLLADVDAQYHTTVAGHDVVVGGGYRFLSERTDPNLSFSIDPTDVREHIVNAFAQDEVELGRRVRATVGAKVERDPTAGWTVQPTARVMWSVMPKRGHVWGAVSRAVHTPSLADLSARFNVDSFIGQGGLPVLVGVLGNPAYRSQVIVSAESGIRVELGAYASVDLTAFRASYDGLKTNEPLMPVLEASPAPLHLFVPIQFGNLLQATTHGVEIAARWKPLRWWRLEAGYSSFRVHPHLSAESADADAAAFDGNVPGAQWQARSAFSLGPRLQLDAALYRVGALPRLGVDAYTRLDGRFEVVVTSRLSAIVVGQNLLDRDHAEYAGRGAFVTATRIPRSGLLQLRWQF
jgi:iron complex outermembrane recepter protein